MELIQQFDRRKVLDHGIQSSTFPCPCPLPCVHSRDFKGLWGPQVDVITRSSGVKNNPVWQTGQEAGHPLYHVNENERIYGQEGYPTQSGYLT